MTFPAEAFAPEDLTCDGFLDGRVRAFQPRRGYRAAMDPVFLAAAVPAQPGQAVLELGCGVGVASLCLAARVPDIALTGVERQPGYAALARLNAAENGVSLKIAEADIATLPSDLRAQSFDHVFANPPYYKAAGGTVAADPGREAALREETPLNLWIDVALRRLRPGGWVTVIQAADRLADLLRALDTRAGNISVLPIASRTGHAARRVLVQARKGGRGAFTLLAPFIVHEGPRHEADGDTQTDQARAILRKGQALVLGPRA